MKTLTITPALNYQIIHEAQAACTKAGTLDRKFFNKAYNEAIKAAGYTPAYFKSIMRKIGSEYPED